MKITKPQEMTSGTSKVEEAVSKFEERFAKDEKRPTILSFGYCSERSNNEQTCDEVTTKFTQKQDWRLKLRILELL